MNKKWLIICIMLFQSVFVGAQQLSNVYLNQNGKASYRITLGNIYIVISEAGKLKEIKTDAQGTIVYSTTKRVEQIGNTRIGFNYQGWVNTIGSVSVQYDYSGRVDRVGNLVIRYNYNGIVQSIGNQNITYNADNSMDMFDRYKITYNYNKQVQQVDNSNGLILLELNYDK
jgi:hypothetical protein